MRADVRADIAATVIVGGFMEGLIGPLSPLNRQQESQAEAYRHDVAVLADQIATLACASVAAATGALRQLPGDAHERTPALRRADGRLRPGRDARRPLPHPCGPEPGRTGLRFQCLHRRRGAAGRHRARSAVGAIALRGLGALAGDEQTQELARLANRHAPELKTHDRYGNRIDWVEFHPSWHALMTLAWKHEVPNLAWRADAPGGHYARAVLSYLWNQVEHGTGCPTGMAYAAHAGFEAEPALAVWKRKSLGTEYEFSRREVGDKPSVVIGYAMTEKQGGSDLRQTQTTARYSHTDDYHGAAAHWYELTGHKWFCSVPQSDGFSRWPRWTAASPASSCRAPCPMVPTTASTCSA